MQINPVHRDLCLDKLMVRIPQKRLRFVQKSHIFLVKHSHLRLISQVSGNEHEYKKTYQQLFQLTLAL